MAASEVSRVPSGSRHVATPPGVSRHAATPRGGSGSKDRRVECIVCHSIVSQKSIKTHFINKHKDHDYEEQKRVHTDILNLSRNRKSASCSSLISSKSPKKDKSAHDPSTGPAERADVVVGCVICCEMLTMKSMKGHFIRHHPEQNYETLKPTMSSASPAKKADFVQCVACKESVSLRTLKVHILKNHPELEYKSTLKHSRERNLDAKLVKNENYVPGTLPQGSASVNQSSNESRKKGGSYFVPCIVCQKQIIWINMKKHFIRKHVDQLSKYEDMKELRSKEREENGGVKGNSGCGRSDSFIFDRHDRSLEVNNNSNPSAALEQDELMRDLAALDEDVMREMAADPYSRLLASRQGLQIQVTEQVIRFDAEESADFTQIDPPSSKVVPLNGELDFYEAGIKHESRKRKADGLEETEDQDYKRLATENYLLERQILYLQEQEEFLARKMLAFQKLMTKKMRDFEEKMRLDFEEKTRKIEADFTEKLDKMKVKLREQEREFLNKFDEQRRINPESTIPASLPSPSTSEDTEKSSVTSNSTDVDSPERDSHPAVKTPEKPNDADSEETDIDDSAPSQRLPKKSKSKVKKVKTQVKIKKSDKVGKVKKINWKLKLKPRVKDLNKKEKPKVKCEPCDRFFRDQWDYKKHCNTLCHQRVVTNTAQKSPLAPNESKPPSHSPQSRAKVESPGKAKEWKVVFD